jgi:hypothetical protein
VKIVTTHEAAPIETPNSAANRGSSGSVTRCEMPLPNAASDSAMKANGEISGGMRTVMSHGNTDTHA